MKAVRYFCLACAVGIIPSINPSTSYAQPSGIMRTSYYSSGTKTASGYRFSRHDPTIAAHRTLPFGTVLHITNPRNGRSIRAVVRDRGPFIHGRHLDLSRAGAAHLGFIGQGVANLRVTILGRRY